MGEKQMILISEIIDKVLNNIDNETIIQDAYKDVKLLCDSFPLYPHIS